jgi:hypothetical protein
MWEDVGKETQALLEQIMARTCQFRGEGPHNDFRSQRLLQLVWRDGSVKAGGDQDLAALLLVRTAVVGHTRITAFRLVPALWRWKHGSIKVEAPLRLVRHNVLLEVTLGLAIVLTVSCSGP